MSNNNNKKRQQQPQQQQPQSSSSVTDTNNRPVLFANIVEGASRGHIGEQNLNFTEASYAQTLSQDHNAIVGVNLVRQGGEGHINQQSVTVGGVQLDTAPKPKPKPKDCYAMGPVVGPPKRGRCVVLNYHKYLNYRKLDPKTGQPSVSYRAGSDLDVRRIRALFEDQLNFAFVECPDLSREDTKETVNFEVQRLIKSDHHCFVLFVLAHGAPGKFMCGGYRKEDAYTYDELLAPFDGVNCPALNGKPKLVFIQACQGLANDEGTCLPPGIDGNVVSGGGKAKKKSPAEPEPIKEEEEEEAVEQAELDYWKLFNHYSDPRNNPAKADLLVFCASYKDHFSVRIPGEGTWFIQALCEVLEQQWREQELDSMLNAVKERVKARQLARVSTTEEGLVTDASQLQVVKQIPNIVANTLSKSVVFYEIKK